MLHAPSDRKTKGTWMILDAVERLRVRGVRFEFRMIERAAHDRLRRELEDADVVIDQLHLPLHGKLGVEAMASGCALATSNQPAFEPWPGRRPIWHIEPTNLDARLETLVTDRALRLRLATRGRRYVERHHDVDEIVAKMLARLDGTRVGHQHQPEFFARHYRLAGAGRLPQSVMALTARVVDRWGLPAGVDPQDLVRRGLMSSSARDRAVQAR